MQQAVHRIINDVSEFLQPIEVIDIYWHYCKFDQGIMEYWNDVKEKKPKSS